jgi:hypothetical protein
MARYLCVLNSPVAQGDSVLGRVSVVAVVTAMLSKDVQVAMGIYEVGERSTPELPELNTERDLV